MRRRQAQPNTYLPVLYSGDKATLALARCLLDAEGIPYAVTSDLIQDLIGGLGRIGSTHNFITGPAEVVVNRGDVETARELLSDLVGYIPPWRPQWLRWYARISLLLSLAQMVLGCATWFVGIPKHIHLQ
jgi:hypothetical protein